MAYFVFCFLIVLSIAGRCTHVQAQQQVKRKKKSGMLGPIIAYQPETRLQLGVFAMKVFKPKGCDTVTRPSNVQFSGFYTLNKQLSLTVPYSIFFNRESYQLLGSLAYTRYPEYYYGIGHHSQADSVRRVDYRQLNLNGRLLRKVANRLFAGLQYRFVRMYQVVFAGVQPRANPEIPGASGGNSSGIGPVVVIDKRNSVLSPTQGCYFEASVFYHTRRMGSHFNYSSYTFDARKYFFGRGKKNRVLALQALMNFNAGRPPFRQFALLGGSNIMRGYYQGRFRDNHFVGLQAEYRQAFSYRSRLGYSLFAAVGDVASRLKAFHPSHWKAAYGAGLRFRLIDEDNVNIRFDVGFGRHTRGMYVTIGEAF